jgi:alpha-amylase
MRYKDAGRLNSSAIGATEDAVARRSGRSGGSRLRFDSSFSAVAACAAIAFVVGANGGGATASGVAAPKPPSGPELRALASTPSYSAFGSQRIYFVMPDRYANGDPTNDQGGVTGPRSQTGYDPTDSAWYHGGDLKGLTGTCTDSRTGLARIKDLGFTGIWVAPVVVQKTVQGDSAAYHGYWGVDLTRVDPHLGTNEDFAAFADCAHRLGLKVYLDIVVNHAADVILLAGGTTFLPPSQVPYRNCKGRPFRAERYAGKKAFPCLSAKYQPREALVLPDNRTLKHPAWLNDVVRYHNRGDIDFSSCSPLCFEQGDFYGLDDLFTEQPFVVNGLAQVYGDWIRRYKLDGFRVDTAKHVDRAFFRSWVPKLKAAALSAGVRDFEIFGEVFTTDASELASFVRNRKVPNVIDFPLQDALVRYAGGSAGAKGIASRLADDDYFRGPNGLAPTPATFLGNHDVGRAAMKIREQTGAEGTELLRRDLLGQDLLYLLRGAPVVYYGDEVGMIGRGGDKAARQDMFPTKVEEWQTEDRVASPPIGTGSSFDVSAHPVAQQLRALGALRDAHPALSSGASFVRVAKDGVLAVSRIDSNVRREYLAVFNAGKDAANVTVQTSTPASSWAPLMGATTSVSSAANGRVALRLEPLSAVLYRADAELPRRGPARLTLTASSDLYTDLLRLTATAASQDPLSVTFAARRSGSKSWRRLAVDDGGPYRAFVDPGAYRRGERVYFVAVARASDGSVSTSPVLAVTPRR